MEKVYLDKTCTKIIKQTEDSVEIDRPIALLIALLNRKGYKTLFCCSGHDNSNPYITFEYSEKTRELCNYVFDMLCRLDHETKAHYRITKLDNYKTISIYTGKFKFDTIDFKSVTYIIKSYVWLKTKMLSYKDDTFEQDYLNIWTTPTKTE